MTQNSRWSIRERYNAMWPSDGQLLRDRQCLQIDPYKYGDWASLLSGGEFLVWTDIRKFGLPFLPEFPVGNYFIDFADPITMVGIEIQSKAWHSGGDKIAADLQRREKIESMGWHVVWVNVVTVLNYASGFYILNVPCNLYQDRYSNHPLLPRWESYHEGYLNRCLRCENPNKDEYYDQYSPFYGYDNGYCECRDGGRWTSDTTNEQLYSYITP